MSKPPAIIELHWRGAHRFDAGRPGGPTIRMDGDKETGPTPVETLVCALAGCTTYDVVDILEKRRTPASAVRVEAEATRADAVPARVTAVRLVFHVDGEGIDAGHATRAVELAVEKYCSVKNSLDPAIPVAWSVVLNGTALG